MHTHTHTYYVVEVDHLWFPVSQDFSHSIKVKKKHSVVLNHETSTMQ